MNLESPIKKLAKKKEKIEPCLTEEMIHDLSKSAQSNYFMVFSRIPEMTYFLTSFSFPTATNRKITIPRPWHSSNYDVAGHATDYDEISLTFLVSENYKNYFNILKWMRENENTPHFVDTVSRASLIILNNSKIPLIRVDFLDILPSSLGDLQFNNQSPEIQTSYCTLSMYNYSVTYLDKSLYIEAES